MNVEASRSLDCPATRRGRVHFFVRACSLPVMLAAAWMIVIAGECQAGVILTCESGMSAQTIGHASSVPPVDNHQREDDERASADQNDTLPLGTGAANVGSSLGGSTAAALYQPSGYFPSPALGSFLEERRLSLPASPVFDRLQPPRA